MIIAAIYHVMTVICAIAALFQRHRSAATTATTALAEYSFEAVYEENFEFVWRTVGAFGVSLAQRDDAVQEVFIVIHRRLSAYTPEASLRSWIFGIVRRVARDFRRAQQRRGTKVAATDVNVGADGRDPYFHATRNEALSIVLAFADTLDEEWRALFILSELEQLSAPEIAAAMALNLNTVYSRIRSVRSQLAKFMNERTGDVQGVPYE
ncbi:MAG: RNA polymerase sigma factor [Deltaproteobacteria bacterium]|nr:RNA polymerase sigma factor [Deltaproteobacteria bacterium]